MVLSISLIMNSKKSEILFIIGIDYDAISIVFFIRRINFLLRRAKKVFDLFVIRGNKRGRYKKG
jgi:hypothetical protein